MTPFKERMNLYRAYREQNPDKNYWDWKASVAKRDNDWGYQEWKRNLPENLRYESSDYDLYGAYKSGMQPVLESDGVYHLGSRDPQTGRILKRKGHPTYQMAIDAEKAAGYDVYEGDDGEMYSKAPLPNQDISGWQEFKDYYNSNELGAKERQQLGGVIPAMQGGGETTDQFIAQFGDAVTYGKDDTNLIGDIGNWWNDLTGMKNYGYGYCAITPNGKLTTQCAKYSNDILRDQGYKNITGDAWNRAAYSNMEPITSGYTGLKKPKKYTKDAAHEYLRNAANNFAENVDTTKLITNDVIGIYYPDSPNTQKAFEGGQWGETQTHTGHTIVGKDGTHYVVHNVDGHLKINKLADMLTGKYDYLPVSAYRPRK